MAEETDAVRVRRGDADVLALLPRGADGDVELDWSRSAADPRTRSSTELTGFDKHAPADGALAGARADGIGQRHVLVEDDAELDDPEEEERDSRGRTKANPSSSGPASAANTFSGEFRGHESDGFRWASETGPLSVEAERAHLL